MALVEQAESFFSDRPCSIHGRNIVKPHVRFCFLFVVNTCLFFFFSSFFHRTILCNRWVSSERQLNSIRCDSRVDLLLRPPVGSSELDFLWVFSCLIQPPPDSQVAGISTLEYDRYDEVVEMGYRCAMKALQARMAQSKPKETPKEPAVSLVWSIVTSPIVSLRLNWNNRSRPRALVKCEW